MGADDRLGVLEVLDQAQRVHDVELRRRWRHAEQVTLQDRAGDTETIEVLAREGRARRRVVHHANLMTEATPEIRRVTAGGASELEHREWCRRGHEAVEDFE